ncbi:potassium channel family protein [Natronoglycomyces albus]|uniref:NAD-binding protein n=1 Tax=Natronoglycomyces albus TaxID=2811108 RepID=A0A895XM95_9ACTN|nr:potassium channel protein [Natronoglycomyces albus]QSB06474.1 NAD-binding protein [Natronoglycomyces albus]
MLGEAVTWMLTKFQRWETRLVVTIFTALLVMMTVHTVVFHYLMSLEGRSYSWVSGFYWTVSTMSTLGFGDITFVSDLGRIYSIFVVFTGALFIFILLPFVVVRLIIAPWLRQQEDARAPRRAPGDMRGHIVLTSLDSISQALIARARRAQVPYVVIVDQPKTAIAMGHIGYKTMVGPLDSPRTYVRAGIERAAMVTATLPDTTNTNIAFTVREIDQNVVISVTADREASVDVLGLAGSTQVIQLASYLGSAMAHRVLGTSGRTHVLGQYGATIIAEAGVIGTELVGRQLGDIAAESYCGIRILAVIEHGQLEAPLPNTVITDHSSLILAGTDSQLHAYEKAYAVPHKVEQPVIIVGGGRVGRAAARTLADLGVPHVVIERQEGRVPASTPMVLGDAAEISVLNEAGFDEASAVLVTTHEDDMNVYLALYCRRLRSDVQIVARAVDESNVSTLRRAGADGVLSYAAIGATAMWNALNIGRRIVVVEGIELFEVPVTPHLIGQRLHDLDIFHETGCYIVAAMSTGGDFLDADSVISAQNTASVLVMGNRHDELKFRKRYVKQRAHRSPRRP